MMIFILAVTVLRGSDSHSVTHTLANTPLSSVEVKLSTV